MRRRGGRCSSSSNASHRDTFATRRDINKSVGGVRGRLTRVGGGGAGAGGGDEDEEGDDTDCSSSHIWSPAQSNSSSLLTLHGERGGGAGGAAAAVEPAALPKRPRDMAGVIIPSGAPRRFGSARDPVSRPQPTGCEADISSSGSTNSASCMSLSEPGARGGRVPGAHSLRTPSPCRGLAESPGLTRAGAGRVPPAPLPSPPGVAVSPGPGPAGNARPSALPLLLPAHCAAPRSLSLGSRSPAKPLSSPTTGSPRDDPIPLLTLLAAATAGSSEPQAEGLVSPQRGSLLSTLSPASSSSSSSLNHAGGASSPPARRWRYASCSDGHGARAAGSEQHPTPLQQRDLTIRHLRNRLRDTEGLLGHREREVQELKCQLERMREDWVEEECHRVEAQLALKEARREIRQLRQAVDVMEVSLHEKDQGLQKYFADISLQNRKLEALLHSMEVAQGGAAGRHGDADGGDCDAPRSPASRGDDLGFADESLTAETSEPLGRPGAAAGGGGGGGAGGGAAIAVAVATGVLRRGPPRARAPQGLEASLPEETIGRDDRRRRDAEDEDEEGDGGSVGLGLLSARGRRPRGKSAELGVQADIVICDAAPPGGTSTSSSASASVAGPTASDGKLVDLSRSDPTTILLMSPASGRRGCRCVPPRERPFLLVPSDRGDNNDGGGGDGGNAVNFWSRHAVLDWAAVAVPLIPTVAWLVSRHRADELARQEPLYNIATVLRGCCLLALSRLRVPPPPPPPPRPM